MEETTDIFSQEDYFEIAIFEQYKRKVIKACEAANELDCSTRTFYRKYKKYLESGLKSLIKPPRKRESKFDSNSLVELYKNEYYGFSIEHFKEKLKLDKNIDVSYATVYRALRSSFVLSPYAQRKTIRKAKKDSIPELKYVKNEVKPLENSNIYITEKPTNRLPKGDKAGFLIEMDASSATFFGNKITHLHLAVDVCTGNIVGAYLDKQETATAYFNVLKQIFTNYGLPQTILTDNRSCFVSTRSKKDTTTSDGHVQIEYALKSFGVHIETTSQATRKAIIERANGTCQRRLCAELRQKGIETLEAANEYLINHFVPEMNKLFGGRECKENLYGRKIDENEAKIRLCCTFIRSFDKAGTVSFKGKKYYPAIVTEQGEINIIRNIKDKTECVLSVTIDDLKFITIDGHVFKAVPIETLKIDYQNLSSPDVYKLDRTNIATSSEIEKEFKKPKYTPWRTNMFKLFLHKKGKNWSNN